MRSLVVIGRRPSRATATVLIAPTRMESATLHWTRWRAGERFYAFLFRAPR